MIGVRFLHLILLAGLIIGLYAIQSHTGWAINEHISVSLGFLLLMSYVIGEIVAIAHLPRLSGYLVSGIIFGPGLFSIVSKQIVVEYSFINELALCLIAFTAGAELKVSKLRRDKKAISSIALLQIFTIIGFVSLFVYSISDQLPWIQSLAKVEISIIAVLIGVISYTTSPSAKIAIIIETGAEGPFTDTILGTTVVKDMIVMILFAIAYSFSKTLLPDYVEQSSLLLTLFRELFGSIAIGIAVGFLIAGYIKYTKLPNSVFILGMAFVIVEVSHLFHLHFVLVCIMAGFSVENFSEKGHALVEAIEKGSLPIYVLFFSLAGAHIDFKSLTSLLPVAILLFLVRAVSVWMGAYGGSKLAGVEKRHRPYFGLGFISQAGISIGLTMIASTLFPSISLGFQTLMFSVIAMNEIIGPILFKFALYKAGETGKRRYR